MVGGIEECATSDAWSIHCIRYAHRVPASPCPRVSLFVPPPPRPRIAVSARQSLVPLPASPGLRVPASVPRALSRCHKVAEGKNRFWFPEF